jgi:hypothetical protein
VQSERIRRKENGARRKGSYKDWEIGREGQRIKEKGQKGKTNCKMQIAK